MSNDVNQKGDAAKVIAEALGAVSLFRDRYASGAKFQELFNEVLLSVRGKAGRFKDTDPWSANLLRYFADALELSNKGGYKSMVPPKENDQES